MTTEKKTEAAAAESRARIHARFGWTLLFVSLAFGSVLETMEGFRWVSLVSDPWKQRLWSLGHFHGAALGLLNLVYVQWADTQALGVGRRKLASRMLILGSVAMPLGFLLGGIAHPEGDPSIGIILAPVGALFVLVTAAVQTLGVWRRSE